MADTETTEKPKEQDIGNSRFTQAMGEAGNTAILVTLASTAVIASILYFGKEKVKIIGAGLKKIEDGFDAIKRWLGNGAGNGSDKIKDIMASVTAASGLGYLIGHIAMLPAFRSGWDKADAEKKRLSELAEQNAALEKKVAEQDKLIASMQQGEDLDNVRLTEQIRTKQGTSRSIESRGGSHSEAYKNEKSGKENVRS